MEAHTDCAIEQAAYLISLATLSENSGFSWKRMFSCAQWEFRSRADPKQHKRECLSKSQLKKQYTLFYSKHLSNLESMFWTVLQVNLTFIEEEALFLLLFISKIKDHSCIVKTKRTGYSADVCG